MSGSNISSPAAAKRGPFDQPLGLTVRYRILQTRTPADGVVLGYTQADFTFADGTGVSLNLSVLVTRTPDGWQIAHYQVSPLPN